MEFKDTEDITQYLNIHIVKGSLYSPEQIASIYTPIFMASMMDDVTNLLHLSKMAEFRTGNQHLFNLLGKYGNFKSETLTLSRFHVLCGFRGPVNLENFESEVIKNIDNPIVKKYSKHKDFPQHIKMALYAILGDVEYFHPDILHLCRF